MSLIYKWVFLLSVIVSVTACSDGHPTVDFLVLPTIQKVTLPGSPSSVNLSPTTTVSGGSYKLKGRVTYLQTQNELSGGTYKVKGKVSF